MKTLFLTTMLTILSIFGYAQNFDKTKLDNYFNTLEENNKLMASVAISKDGKIIYSKSIGFSDVENNIKANANSKYRIGSISKTFTAVLVFKAIEEKKLKLDKTIDAYFPSIKNANKITIKQLLGHRSGIHNFTNDGGYRNWNTQAKTEQELIEIIQNGGSDFEPNSKSEYSNSNYVLLTFILEKTFNKPYAQLVQKYITKPLNLNNTYLGKKIDSKNNECKSYSYLKNWKLSSETDMSIPLGAGAIVSTPIDLVKFSNALFSGKLLKPENLEMMKTIEEGFGLGLFKIPFNDKTSYGHTGGIDDFVSVFGHFSDDNLSFALTVNGANFNHNDVSIAVLSAVYDKPYSIPNFTTYTYKVDPKDLDQYLGIYASEQIPLKITITKEENILIAQATGQSAFPLDASEKHIFRFDSAGIVMEFNPLEKTMTLKQGGGTFKFKKEAL